jgi:hypothetical protein
MRENNRYVNMYYLGATNFKILIVTEDMRLGELLTHALEVYNREKSE